MKNSLYFFFMMQKLKKLGLVFNELLLKENVKNVDEVNAVLERILKN